MFSAASNSKKKGDEASVSADGYVFVQHLLLCLTWSRRQVIARSESWASIVVIDLASEVPICL